jgi:hypothetical protein
MRRVRFSIASLILVIVFVAVGIAALRAATEIWDAGLFGTTLGILLISVLLAVHRAGRRRAYWLGFALFGGTYLVATLVPPVESRLPTTAGLHYLNAQLPNRDTAQLVLTNNASMSDASDVIVMTQKHQSAAQDYRLTFRQTQGVRLWDAVTGRLLSSSGRNSESFRHIGQSLLALVVAFVGGQISRVLAPREDV